MSKTHVGKDAGFGKTMTWHPRIKALADANVVTEDHPWNRSERFNLSTPGTLSAGKTKITMESLDEAERGTGG